MNMTPTSPKDASKLEEAIEKWKVPIGNLFVSLFHRIALFGIGAATVWSAAVAFLGMVNKGSASIEDLLLLFIYLEIGAMVGIYFKTNHMPVRFLIYVAITAVTRLIIDLVNTKHEADMAILFMGLTILILALANAVVRYASFKYPSTFSVFCQALFSTFFNPGSTLSCARPSTLRIRAAGRPSPLASESSARTCRASNTRVRSPCSR
jgi:phosphate starvation-inducible membrane PsiE